MYNIPNLLTLFRVVLIPVMVVVFYLPVPLAGFYAALIFTIAAVTDWLDGYLARKLNQTSSFGAFMDPVADKLIVATALVMIAVELQNVWVTIAACIMIGREIVISALREWMAEVGKRGHVAVSWLGKYKTTMQMVALVGLLAQFGGWFDTLALAALFVAAVLTVWSMAAYLVAAKRALS